jgi:hypothetical protein
VGDLGRKLRHPNLDGAAMTLGDYLAHTFSLGYRQFFSNSFFGGLYPEDRMLASEEAAIGGRSSSF